MMPPGPTESATCMTRPYLPGISRSPAQASNPPTEIAAITKSAATSDSRWSSVLRTVRALPSPSISFSPSSCITASRCSSMSIKVTSESPSTWEEISLRRSSGTKLELPPPMIVTFFPTVVPFVQPIESSLMGRIEASKILAVRGRVMA